MQKTCHSCRYRHSCCPFSLPEQGDCPHWEMGKCYTCKHVNANEVEWAYRGCEAEYPSGCRQYRRNWKLTLGSLIQRVKSSKSAGQSALYVDKAAYRGEGYTGIKLYIGPCGSGKTYQIMQDLQQHIERFPDSKVFCWCTSAHSTWNKLCEYKSFDPVWVETSEIPKIACREYDTIVFDGVDVSEEEFMASVEHIVKLSESINVYIALRWYQVENPEVFPLIERSTTIIHFQSAG